MSPVPLPLPPSPLPDVMIGRFAVRQPLGRRTWRVQDTERSRPMVLTWLERDVRELPVLLRVSHPGLSLPVESGERDGHAFAIAPFVPGTPLSTLSRAPLTGAQCARFVRDAARAIHHLHQAGVTHGALTADRVIVPDDGRVTVTGAALYASGTRGADIDGLRGLLARLLRSCAPMPPGLEALAESSFDSAGGLADALDAWMKGAPPPTRRHRRWIIPGIIAAVAVAFGLAPRGRDDEPEKAKAAAARLGREMAVFKWRKALAAIEEHRHTRKPAVETRALIAASINDLRDLTAEHPDIAHGWFVLARVQLEAGRTAPAVASASRAVDLAPNFAQAWRVLGLARWDDRRWLNFPDDPHSRLLAAVDREAVHALERAAALDGGRGSLESMGFERCDEDDALELAAGAILARHGRGDVEGAVAMLEASTLRNTAPLICRLQALWARPQDRAAHASRGLSLARRDIPLLLTLAQIRHQQHNVRDAIAAVDSAIELDPHAARLYALRAGVRDRSEDALRDLHHAAQLDPEDVLVRLHRARFHLLSHEFDAAEASMAGLEHPAATLLAARIALARGGSDRALALARTAVRQEGTSGAAILLRAQLGEPPLSSPDLDAAILLDNDRPELYEWRIALLRYEGFWQRVERDCATLARLRPDNLDAVVAGAEAAVMCGHFNEALAAVGRVAKARRWTARLRRIEGEAYLGLRRHPEAVQSLSSADLDDLLTRALLGIARAESGFSSTLERLLETPAATADDQCAHALVHLACGRPRPAIEGLTRVLAADHDHLRARLTRGIARIEAADPAGAVDDLSRVLDRVPERRDALLQRARAYEALKRNDAAIRDLEEVCRLAPKMGRDLTDAIEMLERLRTK